MRAKSVVDTILGEAGGGTVADRLDDMKAIASVIANRAHLTGVSWDSIVSAPGQFDAYNRPIPPGAEQFRSLAEQAVRDVQTKGPIHTGVLQATPAVADKQRKGLKTQNLQLAYQTKSHVYRADLSFSPIATADGYKPVRPEAVQTLGTVAQTAPSTSIADYTSTGPAGRAYGDLVAPSRVATTTVSAKKGMEALAPNGLIGAWKPTESFNANVDRRLTDILSTAAERFPGFEVQAYSGYRPGDRRNHGKRRATDIRLVDTQTKKALPNYQTPETFRTYEKFAQEARRVQQEKYPELDKSFRWGGYFSGPPGKYGAMDMMHFDIANTGMAGGSWTTGLTDAQRRNFPGAVSEGLGVMVADVPTPRDRPGLPDLSRPAYGDVAPSLPQIAQAEQGARMPSLSDALGIPSARADERAAPSPSERGRPSISFPAESYGALNPEKMGPLGASETITGQDVTPSTGLFDSLGSTAPGLVDANRMSLPSLSGDINTGLQAPDMPESAFAGMALEGGMHRAGLKGVPAGISPPVGPDSLPSLPTAPQSSFPARPDMIAPNTMISPVPGVEPSATVSPVPDLPEHLLSPPDLSTIPSAPPEQTLGLTPETIGAFPPAPEEPSRWQHFKTAAKPVAKNALIGAKIAGLPGAVVGGLTGLMPDISDYMGGPRFTPNDIGSGLAAMQGAFSGPVGTIGHSLSMPGYSQMSLGDYGGIRTGPFGWQVTDPDGSPRGGLHNGKGLTGFLDSLFGGGKPDGSGKSSHQRDKDATAGKAGLW